MDASRLASLEHKIRPMLAQYLPPARVVKMYSAGRLAFLKKLQEIVIEPYEPPAVLARTFWGIRFRSPIFNAAGMFKNGECYELTARQGAAAHLWGTTTALPRGGNEKEGTYLPFTPYPLSHAASNWLGLPNEGDGVVSHRLQRQSRLYDCPIGASLMKDPSLSGEEQQQRLVDGLRLFEAAGVDFMEINESCPNTAEGKPSFDEMAQRLAYVSTRFFNGRVVENRERPPVSVKAPPDLKTEDIPRWMDLLFKLGYNGFVLANTSTNYVKHREKIHDAERPLFDYFTTTFGGGVSGKPLKQISLELAATAVRYLKAGPLQQEFHIIRVGGIENAADLRDSDAAGISLNEWFTGYFENFSTHGHAVYKHLYDEYLATRQ